MNRPLLLWYPRCSTCRKALSWLRAQGIDPHLRDLVADRPTRDELAAWHSLSDRPLSALLNTHGERFRALGLRDRLATATDTELLTWLSSDGMLVKRPLLVTADRLLIGFRAPEWASWAASATAR